MFWFGLRGILSANSATDIARPDQIALALFLPSRALGLYVVALAITNLPYFIAKAIGIAAFPAVAREPDPTVARRVAWRYLWAMIGFAIVLWIADRVGMRVKRLEHMTLGQALVVGLAQPLAFIPGTSRSGITMVAARLMGYEREEAARFSFLLSIPAILAAGFYEGLKLAEGGAGEALSGAGLALLFSAATGLAAIAFLMRWLRRSSFAP